MGAEKARLHSDWSISFDSARHAQHLELRFHIQAIPGFDLDDADTLTDQGVSAFQRGCEQLVLRGAPGRLDRGDNPAARTSDFLIARAFKAHLEFLGPVPAEHQMRVAINQSRRYETVAKRDMLSIRKL